MEADPDNLVEGISQEVEERLNIEDTDSSDSGDFEDLDAYSDDFSDIDITELNPQLQLDDSDTPTISEASSVEVPDIVELVPEKVNIPATQCETTSSVKRWAHEVNPKEIIDDIRSVVSVPAMEFGFELDNFQKQGIYFLEQGSSILVAAHTSSGKTVVAEYAVAMAKRNGTRIIYTSPIKTLSNQSYRSFKQRFEDVGIITGDVQKSPESFCVIMTTEILRDILYKRVESLNNVEFVVFDEVHYINDIERGVVWEEVIILLPAHITIIMLTATVSNALEFAEWVGNTKKKSLHVIYTTKRPIPLEHYIYSSKNLYKVVDKDGVFLDKAWKDASDDIKDPYMSKLNKMLSNTESPGRKSLPHNSNDDKKVKSEKKLRTLRRRDKKMRQLKNYLDSYHKRDKYAGPNTNVGPVSSFLSILKKLVGMKFLPAIIFTFSKKRCNLYASKTRVDFNIVPAKKNIIRSFITKALNRLDKADRNLPQIIEVTDLLLRGIAVHHGGLLPIVKEIVEILFARGLVMCLFATETFAMGVNSPARCVVFSEFRKHDGSQYREILPGEYTQMSGRAGRRGMDTFGVVIVNTSNSLPQSSTLKNMMLGKPKKLESKFRLTYNMIMNLLRIDSLDIDHMISRSFSEHNASTPLFMDLHAYNKEKELMNLPQCEQCDEVSLGNIYMLSREVERSQAQIISQLILTEKIKPALCVGRIIVVNNGVYDNNIGIISSELGRDAVISRNEYANMMDSNMYLPPKFYFKAIVLADKLQIGSEEGGKCIRPSGFLNIPDQSRRIFVKQDLQQDDISTITNMRFPGYQHKAAAKIRPNDVAAFEHSLASAANTLCERSPNIYTIGKDSEHTQLVERQRNAISTIFNIEAIKCPKFFDHYTAFSKNQNVKEGIEALYRSSERFSSFLHEEYSNRVNVLRDLGFIDSSDIVTLKGRVAIEIRRASPLALTEIILENAFYDSSPEEIAAILSIFVYNQKASEKYSTDISSNKLEVTLYRVMRVVEKIAIVEQKYGICEDVDEYLKSFNTDMVTLSYDWAMKKPFLEIMKTTSAMEGVIVRTMVHLEEVCREVLGAAKCLGNNDLASKMEYAVKIMRRDIAFSSSLYI